MHNLSAIEIRNQFIKGELKAVQIAEHFLNRIKEYNKKTGAFLSIFEEKSLKQAKKLDEKWANNEPLGKLVAIPTAIKDNMHIEGEITTCGSKFLENYRAPFSSTAVSALIEEDALILGKTNLDEFAMGSANENSAYFPAKNPWDLERTPGGSSGGSATAIAAKMVLLATGSDTGGSIRQPAAFTGTVGFKPTYGRVSRYGLVAFGSSFDQIGPMTSNVQDAALMMEVMGAPCDKDSTNLKLPRESYLENMIDSLKGYTIGVPWKFVESMNKKALKNFQKNIDELKQIGANIVDIDLNICKHSVAIYYILSTAEASTNLARFDGVRYGVRAKEIHSLDELYDQSRDQGFGFEVKKRILLGTFVVSSGCKEAFYKKAQKMRRLVNQAYDKAFEICDFIASPVSPFTSFKSGSIQDPVEMYLQDIFTIGANLAGLPAISLPSGFSDEHMPYALQLMGPQMHDMNVLHAAHAFEKNTRYFKTPEAFR